MIQTPCGKSITSVTTWNAAYASQHWKLSINSHRNTPPAFTHQKVSRGMSCQLHTGETIRWVCLYLRINRQNCRSNKKAIDYARVPFGWWSEGIPEGQMWKGPGKHFCLTEALTLHTFASRRLAPLLSGDKRYDANSVKNPVTLHNCGSDNLDPPHITVRVTIQVCWHGNCGILTM